MEIQEIRKVYRKSEQVSLAVMLLALPVFGIIYLFLDSGKHLMDVPEIPEFLVWVLALICIVILVAQYLVFNQKIKLTFNKEVLLEKVKIYSQATIQRYLILLGASLMCSLGLLLSQNPVFTLLFAITLTFFSLAKPTPDRMARLMKLKKVQMDLIRAAARPEIPDSEK